MGKIFGIPDKSRKIGWKQFLAMIVFGSILVLLKDCGCGKAVWIGFVGAAILSVVVAFLIVIYHVRRPANRVAKLAMAGKLDEACTYGLAVLEKHPEDHLTRMNTASLLLGAERLDEARRVFQFLKRESLPEKWQTQWDKVSSQLNKPPE